MENKDLEKAIYRWFNMKYELYEKLETDYSIYWYYLGQEYAQIRIDKPRQYIYYEPSFRDEFFEIFPIEIIEFKRITVKWIEDTFNLTGFIPTRMMLQTYGQLKIPN